MALKAVGSNPITHLFCFLMGYRQGVRHRTLTPTFAGSNPASPAKSVTDLSVFAFSIRIFLEKRSVQLCCALLYPIGKYNSHGSGSSLSLSTELLDVRISSVK